MNILVCMCECVWIRTFVTNVCLHHAYMRRGLSELNSRLTVAEQGALRRGKHVDEWHEALADSIKKAQGEVQRRGMVTARLGEHLMREMTEQSVERQDLRVLVDNAVTSTRDLNKNVEQVSRANNNNVGVVNNAIDALKSDINAIRLAIATKSNVIVPASSAASASCAVPDTPPSDSIAAASQPPTVVPLPASAPSAASVHTNSSVFTMNSLMSVDLRGGEGGDNSTHARGAQGGSGHPEARSKARSPLHKSGESVNTGDQGQYWGLVRDEVMREMKSIGNSYFNTIRMQCNESIQAVGAAQDKGARATAAAFERLRKAQQTASDSIQTRQSELVVGLNSLRADMQLSAADTEKKLEEQVREIARMAGSLRLDIVDQVRLAGLAWRKEQERQTAQGGQGGNAAEETSTRFDVAVMLKKLDNAVSSNRRAIGKNNTHVLHLLRELSTDMRAHLVHPEPQSASGEHPLNSPQATGPLAAALDITSGGVSLRSSMGFERSLLAVSGRKSKIATQRKVAKGLSATATASSSALSSSSFRCNTARNSKNGKKARTLTLSGQGGIREGRAFSGNVSHLILQQAITSMDGVPFA
jgi:hypothetical protein